MSRGGSIRFDEISAQDRDPVSHASLSNPLLSKDRTYCYYQPDPGCTHFTSHSLRQALMRRLFQLWHSAERAAGQTKTEAHRDAPIGVVLGLILAPSLDVPGKVITGTGGASALNEIAPLMRDTFLQLPSLIKKISGADRESHSAGYQFRSVAWRLARQIVHSTPLLFRITCRHGFVTRSITPIY